jgi:hypothetical protein
VELLLVSLGAVCLVAAVAGVGVKALNVEIGTIKSGRRQTGLAVLGAGFIAAGVLTGGDDGKSEKRRAFPTTTLPPQTGEITPASAAATSTLQPVPGITYRVHNLLDNNQTTAWCEGANGNGLGESVAFTFARPILVRRIDIINGYNKEGRFRVNARAQNLEVSSSEGSRIATLHDTSGVQELPIPNSPTTFIKLTIKSAYPGTQFTDLCLTDIQLIGTPSS